MKCRHCGAVLEQGVSRCPECEKNNFALWQMVVAGVAAVAVLAALAVVLYFGMDLDFLKKDDTKIQNSETVEDTEPPYESSVDYTGTEDEVAAAADTVVATINGSQLTNRVLQYYYNMEVYNYVSTNYSYLDQLGLDYTKPLNEQKCYGEEMSWEAYFIQQAVDTWRQYQVVTNLAKEVGFELSTETQEALDSLEEDLKAAAEEAGYDDLLVWLKDCLYADLTVEEYKEYCTLISYYTEYISVTPSDDELTAYYDEHADYFEENSVGKAAGPMVDVRHILIQPEGGTTDENNVTTYTEEEWAACREEAEKILQEWKAGAATEDSFATMANLYSTDSGSNTSGGLYSGITANTNFVEPFLDWCLDESLDVGDTGIIQSDFGYHIMYLSATQPIWEYYAKQWYAQDRELILVEEGVEKWPAEITYEVICINEFNLGA